MTDDLIRRLRGPSPSIPAMRDAANEIERLRAEIDGARMAASGALNMAAKLDSLYAKNEALLVLLQEAVDYAYNPFEPDNQSAYYKRLRAAVEAAQGRTK